MEKAPLLMMPMRLEYRVVTEEDRPQVLRAAEHADQILELRRELSRTHPNDTAMIKNITLEVNRLIDEAGPRKLELKEARLDYETEIWLRWYPDDSFAETGMAPISEAEQDALDAFQTFSQAQHWPNLQGGEMTALWAELVAVAGAPRAVHLMRTQGEVGDEFWEHRIGRICGLPERVAVYALIRNELVQLGTGNDIPANTDWGAGLVSYSPAAVGDYSWVSDFNTALDLGMGMKLNDEVSVKRALKADWLICVGLSGETGTDEIERLIRDRIAEGGFELLHQDTPTNNTPNIPAGTVESEGVQGQLSDHTHYELGSLQNKSYGCELLGEALGIDSKSLMQAKGADEAGHLNAAAMIRVIGPALMDGSLAATTTMDGVSDTEFIELLAQHVQARGLLPGIRLGASAYGILPVTDDEVKPAGNYELSEAEEAFQEFINTYVAGVRELMVSASESATLRVEPDDPDASEKLTDILQTSRVSRRIDVAEEGSDEIAGLGCPYVEGKEDEYGPREYLKGLYETPLHKLKIPDERDRQWPLLYRLAHLSLTRLRELEVVKGAVGFAGRGTLTRIQDNWLNGLAQSERDAVEQSREFSVKEFSKQLNSELDKIPITKLRLLKPPNAQFGDALLRLYGLATQPDGVAHLETLMMEVVDLFQYRLDAWITGLASIRLARLREQHPEAGLMLGYYGMLGRLRIETATGPSDGYIQAPSQGQAVTAAILRSAFLRYRSEGVFQIDLSSRRTRGALGVMDHIRHGVPLPECLGLRGERWLRDHMKSPAIGELRKAFPLENPDTDGSGKRGPTSARCFDGLKLLEAPVGELTPDQLELKTTLHDDMGALADLVVAEAVHHRAAGSADVASAWLRVLSGGPVPHRPEFLRTHRSGHASDYRVTLVLPQASAAEVGSPLRLAEYGLAALIDQRIPTLADARVRGRIRLGNDVVHEAEIELSAHMGLDGINLARIGVEPLKRQLEAHLIATMHGAFPVQKMVEREWILDGEGVEVAGLTVELELGGLDVDVARAASLWQLAHAGRSLSAGDLSNAADPAERLDERKHVAVLHGAAADLWARVERLQTSLASERAVYLSLVDDVFEIIAQGYERLGARWGEDLHTDDDLRLQVASLHSALSRLQRMHLEGTQQRPAAQRLVSDMVGREADLRRPIADMNLRLAKLESALSRRNINIHTLSEARADLSMAIEALQVVVGIESLAVFPVFTKTSAITPLLESSQTADDAVGDWPHYRARLAQLLEHVGANHAGFKVHPDATADDKGDEDADARDETLAPRAFHYGLFLSGSTDISAETVSGIVVDEWVEKRPSTQQDAAIALNYDSPQAEAPNSLILGVPEDPDAPSWDTDAAADMVRRMLDLMKIRALTTQTTPLRDTVLPTSNRVAHVGSGTNERPRLPVATFKAGLKTWFEPVGVRAPVDDAGLDAMGGSWNQINIYSRRRRMDP